MGIYGFHYKFNRQAMGVDRIMFEFNTDDISKIENLIAQRIGEYQERGYYIGDLIALLDKIDRQLEIQGYGNSK
jgi:hypothetical protein